MKRILLGSAVALFSVAAAAQESAPAEAEAQEIAVNNAWTELQDRYYLTPSLSWVFADSGRQTDDGQALSLALGRRWSEMFALEIFAQYNRFDHEQGSDSADLIGLGVNSLFFPTRKIPAYLLLGAGYGDVRSHPGGDENYGTLLLNLGAGYWWQPFDLLFKGVSLRTDAAYRLDAHNDRRTGSTVGNGRKAFGDLVLSVGLNIPLGAVAEPSPPPEPEPVEVVAVVPPPDSDGDGVSDDLDQCPGTPAGTAVDPAGCPVVITPGCRAPEPGEKLDLSGCGSGDVIVLKGVNFEFDHNRLTVNARAILEGVAEALTAAPATNVEIGGHTDAKGSDDYNLGLSERRACAVARHLVGHGIAAGRLSPAGYGEASPVADNETDEGREQNRRVELRILDGAGAGLGACDDGGVSRVAAPRPSPTPEPTAESAPAPEARPDADVPTPETVIEPDTTTPADEVPVEPTPAPAEVTAPSAPAPQPEAPTTAGSSEPVQMVPESDVFDGSVTAPSPQNEAPSGDASEPVQMVPESDVFGGASAPPAAPEAVEPESSPAGSVQIVPESEVF